MDNSTTRGYWFFVNVCIFIMILVVIYALFSYDNKISEKIRNDTREANILGQEYYAAIEEYEPYIGTSSYDGTYTLTEALTFITQNINTYKIYVVKSNIQTDVNNLTFDGLLINEYLDAGYISGLKNFVFDSYNDDSAYYQRYIDLSEDGNINAIYFYRKVA